MKIKWFVNGRTTIFCTYLFRSQLHSLAFDDFPNFSTCPNVPETEPPLTRSIAFCSPTDGGIALQKFISKDDIYTLPEAIILSANAV